MAQPLLKGDRNLNGATGRDHAPTACFTPFGSIQRPRILFTSH